MRINGISTESVMACLDIILISNDRHYDIWTDYSFIVDRRLIAFWFGLLSYTITSFELFTQESFSAIIDMLLNAHIISHNNRWETDYHVYIGSIRTQMITNYNKTIVYVKRRYFTFQTSTYTYSRTFKFSWAIHMSFILITKSMITIIL